jgi:hypothetical protein
MLRAPAGDLFRRRIAEVHVVTYQHLSAGSSALLTAMPIPVIGSSNPSLVRKSFAKLNLPDVRIVASTADIFEQIALAESYGADLELPCYIGHPTPGLEPITKATMPLSDAVPHTSQPPLWSPCTSCRRCTLRLTYQPARLDRR